jgi:hypothetical protein
MTSTTTRSELVPGYPDVTRLAVASFLARYREPTLTATPRSSRRFSVGARPTTGRCCGSPRASLRCTCLTSKVAGTRPCVAITNCSGVSPFPAGGEFELDDRLRHVSEVGALWLSSDAITNTYGRWSRPARITAVLEQVPEAEVRAFYDLGCTIGGVFGLPLFGPGRRGLAAVSPSRPRRRRHRHDQVLPSLRQLRTRRLAGKRRGVQRVHAAVDDLRRARNKRIARYATTHLYR